MSLREVATGLGFPEGPVAMDDGSVIVVEMAEGRITRVKPDGTTQTVATPGGGPNGLAIGPDGALYVCNNGGNFEIHERDGLMIPGHTPASHKGGRIERIDLSTGRTEVLYSQCDGETLQAPNDLVFDRSGGFWFTDHGSTTDRHRTHGALYYARADGSKITKVLRELISPNGVGFTPANFEGAFPGLAYFDSLGVQADGGVCVATILAGGISTFWPDSKKFEHTPLPDLLVTNICWGGADMKNAY